MKPADPEADVAFQVSRWGNGLAVRLTADTARKLSVTEGDFLVGRFSPEGRLVLGAQARALAKADIRRMRQFISSQKAETPPVLSDMRKQTRY